MNRQNKPLRIIHDVSELPFICDAAEAGLLLRRKPEQICKMAADGILHGTKQGRGWLFRRDDLIRYIDRIFLEGVREQ